MGRVKKNLTIGAGILGVLGGLANYTGYLNISNTEFLNPNKDHYVLGIAQTVKVKCNSNAYKKINENISITALSFPVSLASIEITGDCSKIDFNVYSLGLSSSQKIHLMNNSKANTMNSTSVNFGLQNVSFVSIGEKSSVNNLENTIYGTAVTNILINNFDKSSKVKNLTTTLKGLSWVSDIQNNKRPSAIISNKKTNNTETSKYSLDDKWTNFSSSTSIKDTWKKK